MTLRRTLLDELRAELAALRSARPRASARHALVRAGAVEIISSARAHAVRAAAPSAVPTLIVDLGPGPRVRRMTFLVDLAGGLRGRASDAGRPGRDDAGSRTPREPKPTG